MDFNMNQSLGFILNRTAIASKNLFSQLIKHYKISPEQWSVIFRIVQNPGVNQKEVADSTYKDQGNLTRMIDKLVEKEYVERFVDEHDRRSLKLYPTQKSSQLVQKVIPLSSMHNQTLTKNLTYAESEKLLTLLNKVYQNIQKDNYEK